MADILDKIRKLLRLAMSNNDNEARSSALLAARMIDEHHVVLMLPEEAARASRAASATVQSAPRYARAPAAPKRAKDLFGAVWLFYEEGPPFGGHCLFCALPLLRGQAAYTFTGDVLHLSCWNARQQGAVRPGPAPPSQSRPVAPDPPTDPDAEGAAVDDLWVKMNR